MCHVLIIEDEALIALDIETILKPLGATSFSFAASQGEAVSAALASKPDIITSDVTLFEGTGPAAVDHIRSVWGQVPVVFISATPSNCRADDPLTRVLAKPLDRLAIAGVFQELRHLASC